MALLLVLLVCLLPRLRRPVLPLYPVDFNVYYAAASLVRTGAGAQLYTGADSGADPQRAIAAQGTPIYAAAHAQGLGFVGLYVYPPILADMLVPLTAVPLGIATKLWLAADALFLLLTALLLARLLGQPVFRWKTALLLLALVGFTPVLQCLVDGQITILLLLLWVAGMVLYREEQLAAAGVLFALATAIKLTPALVLLPFLVWRTWRLVLAYAGALLCVGAICAAVNTPHALVTYFFRVMPAMSGAIPYPTNFSLPAATGRMATLLRTGSLVAYPASLAPFAVRAGRVASLVVLAALVFLLVRAGRALRLPDRLAVLALLSLMAPILSPVSWFHAYAMAFAAFALLWQEALTGEMASLDLLGLTLVSLLLGSAVSENLLPMLLNSGGHIVLECSVQLGQLVLAIALVFHRLWRMGKAVPLGQAPRGGQSDGTVAAFQPLISTRSS